MDSTVNYELDIGNGERLIINPYPGYGEGPHIVLGVVKRNDMDCFSRFPTAAELRKYQKWIIEQMVIAVPVVEVQILADDTEADWRGRKVKVVAIREIPEDGREPNYIGKIGTASSIYADDRPCHKDGAYLVKFDDGVELQYVLGELELVD